MPFAPKRRRPIGELSPPPSNRNVKSVPEKVTITVLEYSEQSVAEREVTTLAECLPFKDKPVVTWVNINSNSNTTLVESAGKLFNLHPLVIDNILDPTCIAKLEDFGSYVFGEVAIVALEGPEAEIVAKQVSIVLGSNFVITFHECDRSVFSPIVDRIRKMGHICAMGSDYLVYSIMDLAIDSYYKVLDHVDTSIEQVEDTLVTTPDSSLLRSIYSLKREMIELRKVVWPVRDMANGLGRRDIPFVQSTTLPYFREVLDYSVQIVEMVETSRDVLSGLLDVYLSSQNNRMNEIMKVLTIFSSIFLPLTLIASFFGMNFRYLPGLDDPMSTPILIIIMFGISISMLFIFRKKGWI